ncbi:MAG TPA: hypothetical protein VJL90_07800, partial [Pseudorhodoplanes sp.]|nr:hypothetical protein [Pseudorhodoplanes sp.]
CFPVSPALAQNVPFFVGKWYVADAKVCKSKPGEAEGLLTYTDKKMFGYENHCDIARMTPNGKRIELRMNCSGEGEKYRQTDIVEMQGDKLKVTRTADGRTLLLTYPRCP